MRISKAIDKFHSCKWLYKFCFSKQEIKIAAGYKAEAEEVLKELGLSFWDIVEVRQQFY